MAYRIESKRSIAGEMARLVHEEVTHALVQITDNADRSRGVHEARKSMKKLRALLRLVRSELKPKIYIRENTRFRDSARMLAQARDSFVIYETLDTLRPHLEGDERKTLNALRRRYKALYQIEQSAVLDDNERLEVVEVALQDAIGRVPKWKIANRGFKSLAPNIQQTYHQGSKGYRRAQRRRDSESFHEWRKQVKYLWYHVRLLTPVWSNIMTPLSDELKQLSDDLGVMNDLALVATSLMMVKDDFDVASLITASDHERQRLEQEVFLTGSRVYAESPEAFVKRLESYWDAWEE